jgi:hypothetical protein
MLKMPREEYDFYFEKKLNELNPVLVYEELVALGGDDPILLCWEEPNTWCHRRRVAEWLEAALGIEISEYNYKRAEVAPYALLGSYPLNAAQRELF